MEKNRKWLVGSALVGAALLWFSIDSADAFEVEKYPKVSPYPEVDKRIAGLDIPESIVHKYGPVLTIEDINRISAELRAHQEWVDKVVDEYKWVMTTDSGGVEQYKKLLQAQVELKETLADLQAQSAEIAKIAALQEKLVQPIEFQPSGNPYLDENRKHILIDQQNAAKARIDKLLEGLGIDHLRDVKGNMTEVYTAAHQLSLVGTHGNVWVDGASRPFSSVFGVEFFQSNEDQIPRRPARAFFEFRNVMRETTGWDPMITEGHTGDPNNATSYKGHVSLEHKTGEAADIIPHGATVSDDGAYKLLMGSKGNEYFRIKFEPGSEAEVQRLINQFSERAVKEGKFLDEQSARAWFSKHIDHYPGRFDPVTQKQISGTTGLHFHVVALGGLGHDIDPNGPAKVIASR